MGIGKGNKVLEMKCGGYHTFILTEHSFFGFGRNEYSELGLADNQVKRVSSPRDITAQFGGEKIKKISCGVFHSLILTEKELYALGRREYGQAQNVSASNVLKPCSITKQFKGELI